MGEFFSAKYNLEELIKTNLFIIAPNKSGTTFLKKVLATSYQTWNLREEGQFTYGFSGYSSGELKAGLIWGSRQEWVSKLSDPANYDWSKTRKAWYFQAVSKSSYATVFVEKSPPSLLRVQQLQDNFSNAKFIFMVRNPYAVVEGIYRRRKSDLGNSALTYAAKHLITCFYFQQDNIKKYVKNGIFFRYEDMCAEPEFVQSQIRLLVPELDDLHLRQKIAIKGVYNEVLRDMNNQQLARLSTDDFKLINEVFNQHKSLLAYFGYSILEEAPSDSY